MSTKQMFAVYDSKAQTYCIPFASTNFSTAVREFAAAANDPDTELHRHSLDFSLFHIGNFDEETGLLTSQVPLNLGMAAHFINKTEVTPNV